MKLSRLILVFGFLCNVQFAYCIVNSEKDANSDRIFADNIIEAYEEAIMNLEYSQTDDFENLVDEVVKKKKKKNDIELNQKYFFSLLINIATILLIFFLVYYPNNKHFENIFTFIMFNLMIFLLTFILNKIKISMGAAFGLFAVFSMLRYRM